MSVEKCQSGIALCRAALARPLLDNWTAQIDAQYEKLESSRQRGGPEAAVKAFGPSQRFVPTASSFTIGAVLSDENLLALLAGISAGPPGEWSREEIGGRVACDVDQAWVRRLQSGQAGRNRETGKLGDASSLLGQKEIAVGYGYASGQEAIAHFGLGGLKSCDVEIILPHGKGKIEKKDVTSDQRIVMKQ
jgi:hypothetical protein